MYPLTTCLPNSLLTSVMRRAGSKKKGSAVKRLSRQLDNAANEDGMAVGAKRKRDVNEYDS